MTPLDALTPAEREIARMVAAGMKARDIAARRGCAYRTVCNHKAHIYRKMDLYSARQLIEIYKRGSDG